MYTLCLCTQNMTSGQVNHQTSLCQQLISCMCEYACSWDITKKMYGTGQVQGSIQTYVSIVSRTRLVCGAKNWLCSFVTRYSEMCLDCVLDVPQSHFGCERISYTSLVLQIP